MQCHLKRIAQTISLTVIYKNPLFINPFNRVTSLAIGEKLMAAKNYRTWRRLVEIGLSTKRKLQYNNLVISRLMTPVSNAIVRSILYVQSFIEVWIQLEKRFCLSNGSKKYSLNREVYSMKQDRVSISKYYTKMKCVWEEFGFLTDLPQITQANEEMNGFLKALAR
ncbi:hypothetical protein Cgig2_031351 [Carnegiea gigantea]|uniref:Retrotransposon gag domain-containing protein n=1 Tax=Carnegiea gigantea TaxID=171969 RepID=A0A9Q1JKE4_9CARY|nr:hypothetical protein Cgig2_031351 [Carnegiea gigantea]